MSFIYHKIHPFHGLLYVPKIVLPSPLSNFRTFLHPKKKPHAHSLCPQALDTPHLSSVSIDFLTLNISYK